MTRDTLARHGYKVLEAPNGAKALSVLETHDGAVHLLLTDLVMPGMSGRDLAEQLITGRPGLRVLYTSGYTDDTTVHHGVFEAGMAFIQKPFTPNVLLQKFATSSMRDNTMWLRRCQRRPPTSSRWLRRSAGSS